MRAMTARVMASAVEGTEAAVLAEDVLAIKVEINGTDGASKMVPRRQIKKFIFKKRVCSAQEKDFACSWSHAQCMLFFDDRHLVSLAETSV